MEDGVAQPRPGCGHEASLAPLVIRLAMAHRRLAGNLLGGCGIHAGQERLLFALADGPRPLGELAGELGVNAPTVTKMVSRMERTGMVQIEPSTDDRRVRLAALTPAGRQAMADAAAAWDQLEAATTADLRPDEQAQMADLLRRCSASIEMALHEGSTSC